MAFLCRGIRHVAVSKFIHLDTDFEGGLGPKFHVYLLPNREIRDEAAVEGTTLVNFCCLRAFKGSQKYPIPTGVDLTDYPSVVIWCAQFGVPISPVDLIFES